MGNILQRPLSFVKVTEATEGKNIVADTFDQDQFVQAMFTPKAKVLAEDLGLELPGNNNSTIIDYTGIDLKSVLSVILVFQANIPTSDASRFYLDINYTFYRKGLDIFTERVGLGSPYFHPLGITGSSSIFASTLPINDYSAKAPMLYLADKLDITFIISNESSSSRTGTVAVLGMYELLPEFSYYTLS